MDNPMIQVLHNHQSILGYLNEMEGTRGERILALDQLLTKVTLTHSLEIDPSKLYRATQLGSLCTHQYIGIWGRALYSKAVSIEVEVGEKKATLLEALSICEIGVLCGYPNSGLQWTYLKRYLETYRPLLWEIVNDFLSRT